jgi:ComF family protein
MNLFSRLIDIIYPPRCTVCQAFLGNDNLTNEGQGMSFCRGCLADFRKITSPLCPACGRPFISEGEDDHLCEDCFRKRPYYEAARAPYRYEGAIMTAIHQFKYGNKSFLAESLGPLLARFAEGWVKESRNVLTTPVPLHPKKLRQRTFNQSLLLARHVARKLDSPLDFLSLRRVRNTLPQTSLGKKERRKNVRGAFHVVDPTAFKGKTVLVIDDVATTGNTLNECALALRRSGCKKVLCLVLARAADF